MNMEGAQKGVEEIQMKGRDSIAVKVNIAESSQVDEMAKKTVDKFGKVDIAINTQELNELKQTFG